jgi:hypothetical protein
VQPIQATCDRQFYPAAKKSGERSESLIHWIVLHDGEAPSAASMAEYFRSSRAGGSAHLCLDDKWCYRCLSNTTIPWGAASSFGANTHGLHIEQAGYAAWSAVIWRKHIRTLNRAAYKTALHLHRFHLPVRFVTAGGLLRGEKGVTTHAEISKASRKQDPRHARNYSHSDPGRLWPRRLFMARVRHYYRELA